MPTLDEWRQPVPVFVTDEIEGQVGYWTMPLWLFFLVGLLITINLVGWGLYGLVELIDKVV